MGHGGQISDDGMAVDILTQGKREGGFTRLPRLALEELPNADLHLAGVGNLDTDRVLAGNRGQNIDPLGARGAGEVLLER